MAPKQTPRLAEIDDMSTQQSTNDSNAPIEPLASDFASDADMAELVEFFVGELQDRINALSGAWQSSDMTQLKTLAHQLKGAAGGYGFPTISETAAALESSLLAQESDTSVLNEKLDALVHLCRRAMAA